MTMEKYVLTHVPGMPRDDGLLPLAKKTTEPTGWYWDTECYDRRTSLFLPVFAL